MIWVVSLLLVASGLVDLFVGLWILATAVFVLVVQLASWRRGQLVLLVLLVVVLCAAAVLRRNEARDVPRSPSPASSDLSPWPRHPASRCGSPGLGDVTGYSRTGRADGSARRVPGGQGSLGQIPDSMSWRRRSSSAWSSSRRAR